jgi:hypothetical protein
MKQLIFIVLLTLATSSFGMGAEFAEKLRSTELMQQLCDQHITRYDNLIHKLESIPVEERTELDEEKLNYFKAQLQEAITDCRP